MKLSGGRVVSRDSLSLKCLKCVMIEIEKEIFFLLSQMRSTQRVSVWPVGLVGGMKYERPVVEGGKVGAAYVLLPQLWT